MAKVKIIDSDSLECLKTDILNEIEFTNSQITTYEAELQSERKNRQDEKTIERLMKSKIDWCTKCDVLHQCLCRIQNHTKEIKI